MQSRRAIARAAVIMFDYQTILMFVGLGALAVVAFMILVRPNAGRTRYGRRVGLGQTGRAGNVQPGAAPKEITQPRPANEPSREKRA